jgi:hypothetical protein
MNITLKNIPRFILFLLVLSFFSSGPSLLCAGMLSLSEYRTSLYERLNKKSEICAFEISKSDHKYWALAFDMEYSAEPNNSSFYVISFEGQDNSKRLVLPIPASLSINPFTIKNQIRFFKLINNNQLYIGIKHESGTLYFLIVDVQPTLKLSNFYKIDIPDNTKYFDILANTRGDIRVVFNSQSPSVIAMSVSGKIIWEKKFDGPLKPKEISNATINNDGVMILTSNLDASKTSILQLDKKGHIRKQKEVGGIIANVFYSKKEMIFISVSPEEGGLKTKAILMDAEIKSIAEFNVVPYLGLIRVNDFLFPTGSSSLMLAQIDRQNKLPNSIDLILMKPGSEPHIASKIARTHKNKLYQILGKQEGDKIYLGLLWITKENEHIEKKFEIIEFNLHKE